MAQVFVKNPAAVLDYKIDWALWLGTDTIIASAWATSTGLTIDSSSFTTTTATVWLSGGTLNTDYILTNLITTAAGRKEPRTILIEVRER